MDFAIITNVFFVVTFCQIIVITGILIFTRSNQSRSNKFLAALLAINLLIIIKEFATNNWQWHVFTDYHKILFALFQLGFLSGPLALIYTKVVIDKKFKLKIVHLFHLIPLLLAYSMIFPELYKSTTFVIWWSPFFLPLSISMIVHNTIYIAFAAKYLIKSNLRQTPLLKIKSKMSVTDNSLLILSVLFVLWVIRIVPFVYFFTFNHLGFSSLFLAMHEAVQNSLAFLFLNFSLFIVFIMPILNTTKNNKYFEFIDKNEITSIKEELTRLLVEQKIYQTSEISLLTVAAMLDINPRYLSHIVNNEMNFTFTDLINFYRVNESKRLLINYPDKTIQQIMFEVGFNSKSVFNSLFKKDTGSTPTQFRHNLSMSVIKE
jgi:AraC-like DNA-binding protein